MSFLHSAGTATPTGMGLIPLSWQEIEAFVRCSGLEDTVTPWELQVVKRLSEAYVAEYSKASDPKRKMPYKPDIKTDEIDREAVMKQAISVLGMFKRNKG